MAAPVILVEATPRRATDGVAVTVRLAGGGGELPYFYGGLHWRAGLAGLPDTIASLEFDGEQLGGSGVPQAMELRWSPGASAAIEDLQALYWADAPITVRIGPEGAMPPIDVAGLVLDATTDGATLALPLSDQAADLRRAVLVARFAGTGGIEGPAEWTDLIKPRVWGRCFNVPGRLLDRANQIWCFGDPARAWQAFDQVRDKGVAPDASAVTVLAWQGSVAATFAALQAAAAPTGGGVECPSIACVKWWTEPAGDLRADVRGETEGGYAETAPQIAERIVAARSAITFAAGAVAAAVDFRPAPCGWRIDSDSVTAMDAISDLLSGVSLSWVLVDGAIEFRRWDWTAPTRAARSERVTRRRTFKPVTARKLGYRRNWAPMARGDLADFVLVQDVVYDDGTLIGDAIEDAATTAKWSAVQNDNGARPANYADVTGANIAVGYTNQGPFSTITSAGYGSPLLTGFGALSPLSALSLGSMYLRRADGTTNLTEAMAVTALGIASSIAYQGTGATASSLVQLNATEGNKLKGIAPNATADLVIQPFLFDTAPIVTGNTITKTSGTDTFDSTAAVIAGFVAPCRVSGRTTFAQEVAVSLHPSFANSVDAQAYQIRTSAVDLKAYAYVYGVKDPVALGAFDGNTILEVACDNVNVYLIMSGFVRRSYPIAADQTWTAFLHLKTPGAQILDVRFGTWTDRNFANIGGATRPENNATLGADVASNVRDGASALTRAQLITGLGAAASITGQADWATYTGITTAGMAGRVTNLAPTGNFASFANITERKITQTTRADGSTSVTEAMVVTNQGTASGIAGQADWATYTGITTTGMAGRVTNLSVAGQFASFANITERRITQTTRADGSTSVTEELVVTNLGTASAITGQGPAATDPRSLDNLFGPRQNALYNGGLMLGFDGWSASGTPWLLGSDAGGRRVRPAAAGTQVLTSDNPIECLPGSYVALSADLRGTVPAGAIAFVDIMWFNKNNGAVIQYSSNIGANGVAWGAGTYAGRRDVAALVPAATDGSSIVVGRVRLVQVGSGPIAADFLNVKVETGAVASAFSDDSTLSKLAGIQALADRTGLNIATGITGQGAMATIDQAGASNLAPSSVQRLTYDVLQFVVNCPVGN